MSVQKLSLPDLVVIDQLNQPQLHQNGAQRPPNPAAADQRQLRAKSPSLATIQPEAQSLINANANQDLAPAQQDSHAQITFQCLVSYDKRKDKNLIIKWHHDDRTETIYQWIPELNKRSIAPQYKAYIAPIISAPLDWAGSSNQSSAGVQLLEAGFRLVRPNKELGGEFVLPIIPPLLGSSWERPREL